MVLLCVGRGGGGAPGGGRAGGAVPGGAGGRLAGCGDERDAFKTHVFFPAGKRNGFWNPKKKGLLRIGALCGVRRRPASLRPHRGPAPAVTAYVGGTGKGRDSISPPPGRCGSQRGLARRGRRAPQNRAAPRCGWPQAAPTKTPQKMWVGAAFGRPSGLAPRSLSVILSAPFLSF